MTHLLVEGWRYLPHSYALVNQCQLAELNKRPDVTIAIQDAPPHLPYWKFTWQHAVSRLMQAIC